jgi:hypothetical protein
MQNYYCLIGIYLRVDIRPFLYPSLLFLSLFPFFFLFLFLVLFLLFFVFLGWVVFCC